MKDSPILSPSMLSNETNLFLGGQQTPDYRLIANPFDPPSSVHLKQRLASFSIFHESDEKTFNGEILSIERRAQINPHPLSENVIQIDTSLFNEDLRDRYQRASDHFCQTHLDLPTPVIPNNPVMKSKQSSWSSSSSNSSFERTRTTRHMACQTRLSLPPAADLDSLIQSFASNNSDPDDGVPVIANNSSLNVSQTRRKLFLEEDDLFDDLPPVQVRRSSSFDLEQRSSSPSQQQQQQQVDRQRNRKPLTPDCSPIPLKSDTHSSQTSSSEILCFTPTKPDFFEPNSISSSSNSDASMGSSLMPSDYVRQILDNALAELLECSM